ncbi:hypothetical protein ACO0LC_17940 [Undibacterium sp. JH2W]
MGKSLASSKKLMAALGHSMMASTMPIYSVNFVEMIRFSAIDA